ncbi:hypothetical protein [Nocardioides sp. SLBN-35]|uniref:hypothetical protein n=1 Tax=Nocardioides sp. SLBN-35 TaxID=2768445 RepID=UPI001151816A|nr:hypothetical protein [Nocardioides sp. SLBN-35]TQK70599.1 alpha-1,2-mannosyltransferase [Nocardioides sp. SLBN-35]
MFLLCSLGALNPPITGDVWSADLGAWRLATSGTPWVDGVSPDQLPAWPGVDDVDSDALWTVINPDNGHRVVARSPGAILAGVPAYAIAGWFDTDRSGRFSDVPGSLSASALVALTAALLLLAASRLVPGPVAVACTAALAAGTPLWSIAGNDLWPHTVGVLGIAGMAAAAARERWWLAGILGGVALVGRLHLAVVVAVLGVGVALARRQPGIAVRIAVGSLPFVLLSSVWGHWLYGSWSPTAGYAASSLSAWPASRSWPERAADVAGILVSPGVGVLVWTPCLLVLLPLLRGAWREAPDWVRALAVGGAVYLLIQVYLNPFQGGTGFWGYRLPLETLCACFPLLALAAARLGRRGRTAAAVLVGLQVGLLAIGVLFGAASTDGDGDGSAWRYNLALDALRENPPAFLVILGIGAGAAYLADRWIGSGPAGSGRHPA